MDDIVTMATGREMTQQNLFKCAKTLALGSSPAHASCTASS